MSCVCNTVSFINININTVTTENLSPITHWSAATKSKASMRGEKVRLRMVAVGVSVGHLAGTNVKE